MTTSRQVMMMARVKALRFHSTYYNTTTYIALVVTILLVVQIVLLLKGDR